MWGLSLVQKLTHRKFHASNSILSGNPQEYETLVRGGDKNLFYYTIKYHCLDESCVSGLLNTVTS